MRSVFTALEKDHQAVFHKLDRFCRVLTELRFEGKHQWGSRVREARKFVPFFKKKIQGHMKEEEAVLFPYLCSHIPRLEPMICLLSREHEDFREGLVDLERAFAGFTRTGSDKDHWAREISRKGAHLVCLLRSHMWLEARSVYRSADRELRPDEKKQLMAQIERMKR